MSIKQVYKLWKYEVASNFGINTVSRNGSYFFLFSRRKLENFEISCGYFLKAPTSFNSLPP